MPNYAQESTLGRALKNNTWYQYLLQECAKTEVHYLRISAGLSETDQELLDHYISLCEELEYRRASLESKL